MRLPASRTTPPQPGASDKRVLGRGDDPNKKLTHGQRGKLLAGEHSLVKFLNRFSCASDACERLPSLAHWQHPRGCCQWASSPSNPVVGVEPCARRLSQNPQVPRHAPRNVMCPPLHRFSVLLLPRPLYRLPRAEMHRQHAPAAARTRHIADRIQDLAQVNLRRPAAWGGLGQQRLDLLPLGISQVSRVTAALLKGKLPRTVLLGPHPTDVGPQDAQTQSDQPFSNGHLHRNPA